MPIFNIKFIKKEIVAKDTAIFTFEKPEKFNFIPGQYGGFSLTQAKEVDRNNQNRRFSLLSIPNDPYLQILTRLQPSIFKELLWNLVPGDQLKFAGPSGNFTLPEEVNTPCALIAGGVGIAPFYSMIRFSLRVAPDRQLTLFYGNQSFESIALYQELQDLSKQHSQFKFVPILDQGSADWLGEVGYISDSLIQKNIQDIQKTHFYVCGSPRMVQALHETLQAMEIASENIKTEDFPGYS